MQTFKRICIKDSEFKDDGKVLKLKRGKEYITSAVKDEMLTVFTYFWATVPADVFAGEIEYTTS